MHTIDTNIYNRAATQYTGIDFIGYTEFNGYKLAVNSSGLFEVCCGDNDDGEDIDLHYAPVMTDFGIDAPKRLRWLQFGFDADADFLVEVSTDASRADQYVVKARVEGQQRSRVTISRDLKGRYWFIRIRNRFGSRLSIDNIEASIITLTKGYK